MCINIKQVDERTYNVDEHQVVQDQNGNWVAQTEMTTKQIAAFQRHLLAVEQYNVEPTARYAV